MNHLIFICLFGLVLPRLGTGQAKGATRPASKQNGQASTISTYRFTTAILVRPLAPRGNFRQDTSIRISAALAEADEVLQIKDGPADIACPFHFSKGTVAWSPWTKQAKPGESGADLAIRRASDDVENQHDEKEVERVQASIKVVSRIFSCNGKGPLTTTEILGCSFQNGTFMITAEVLKDAERRGLVIAHEYGHNVCNLDTKDPLQIMYGFAGSDPTTSRQVTIGQCSKYTAPKGSLCPPSTGKP